METRRLGETDMHLTRVGLDTRGVEGTSEAGAVIRAALELGINFIQTAPFRGEHDVARAVAGWPEPKPYVFTRCVRVHSNREGTEEYPPATAADAHTACVDSLRRLGMRAIDLYEVSPHATPEGEVQVWQAIAALRGEKMLRWVGVADAAHLRLAREATPVHALRSDVRLLHDGARGTDPAYGTGETDVLADLPRVASVPSGGSRYEMGSLMTLAGKLCVCAWSEFLADPGGQARRVMRAIAVVDEFQRIGATHGGGAGAAAVAWALATMPYVTAFVISPEDVAQVGDAVAGVDLRLSDEEIARIEALRKA